MDKNDLTEGSIVSKLLRFFFPILFGMLFQQLYNTIDAIIVGKCVGPAALAAVGGSPAVILNLVIGFFVGLSSGATVVISQHYGSRDMERLRKAEHTILLFCCFMGLAVTILGVWSVPWSLRLVQTPADIMEDSALYLRIYYLGTIPLLLFNVGSGILRAVGDSRWPLVFLGVCCVLNIFGDLLLVVAFHMGVAGVAWATVLSVLVSALCVLVHLHRNKDGYPLRLCQLRIHGGSLRRILYIGVPAGIQSSLYAVSNIVIQAAVNALGTTMVAAWTATGKLDGIFWVTSSSFGVAICTFAGQCFGAGKLDRMREGTRRWLISALLSSVGISVLLLLSAKVAFRIFTDDEAVIRQAITIMRYFVPFYFIWSFIEILSNTLRGAGDALWPTVINLLGVCVLRILWMIFVVPRWPGILSISISYPLTWFITGLTFLVYYLKGNWLRRLTGQPLTK